MSSLHSFWIEWSAIELKVSELGNSCCRGWAENHFVFDVVVTALHFYLQKMQLDNNVLIGEKMQLKSNCTTLHIVCLCNICRN